MPQLTGVVLFGTAASISVGGVALTTATGALTFAGTLVQLTALVALNAATSRRSSRPPSQQVKSNFQADVSPRLIHFGQVQVGGAQVMVRKKGSRIFIVMVQGQGEITNRLAHFLDGNEVNLAVENVDPFSTPAPDTGGYVTKGQYIHSWDETTQTGTSPNGDPIYTKTTIKNSRVRLYFRHGEAPASHYGLIQTYFPDWTLTHRLDGLSTVLMVINSPPLTKFNKMFPNRLPTYKSTLQGIELFDPRANSSSYTENPALAIRWILANNPVFSSFEIDDGLFSSAADVCDEPIPTSLGTLPRYVMSGTISLADSGESNLAALLSTCDGTLYMTPEGKWGLRVGNNVTPTVTLESKHLHDVQWSNGPSILEAYTEIAPVYVDRSLGYTRETISPWVDAGLEARYGRKIVGPQMDFTMVPHFTHARRLAKRRIKTDNPIAKGVLTYDLHGLRAWGEDFINIDLGNEFGIPFSGKVRVDNVQLGGATPNQPGAASKVIVTVSVIDSDVDVWSVAEEGDPLTNITSDPEEITPLVGNFAAAPQGIQASGSTFTAGISAVWDEPPYDSLVPYLEYSPAGAGQWVSFGLSDRATSAQISGLSDGDNYDLRILWRGPTGSDGPSTIVEDVAASASTTVPSVPTAFAIADQTGGVAEISITASSSADNWKTHIFEDGVLILSQPTPPESLIVFTSPVGAGSHTYTAYSENVSGVQSPVINATPTPINIT